MDITKAKKFIELEKDDRKILVTLYEGGQVSSCVEEQTKKYCETCQCDDETCRQWIDYLKQRGYESTEIELGELEESLPRFLEQREIIVKPGVVIEREEQVVTPENVGKVEEILGEPEGAEITSEENQP